MKNAMAKIKSFIVGKKDYLISLGVFFCVYSLILIFCHDWPYGNNSVLVSDSYHQICVLYEHIFDVFQGRASLFYTNELGGGFGIFSTIEYMFLNPFYLIPLIGGRKYFMGFLNGAFFLMMCFNIIVFIWFAKKYFKNLKSLTIIIFSLLYCFSGYVVQSTSFATWLIYPALILLVADAFVSMLKTGKITRFIILLTWYVVNCFSVGVATVIMLFVLFSAYVIFNYNKEDRKPILTRLFVSYIIVALASVVILFPAIADFLGSNRSSSVFKNLFVYNNNGILSKVSVIFADAIPMILTIIYFVKCNKKEAQNKFFICAFVLLLFPLFFDSVQKLFCGSTYQGFYSRFYFPVEALIFYLACRCLNDKMISYRKEPSPKPMLIIFSVSAVVIVSFVAVYVGFTFKSIGSLNKGQGLDKKNLTLINFLIFAIAAWFMLGNKIFSKKVMQVLLSFACLITLGFNIISFAGGLNTNDNLRLETRNLVTQNQIQGKVKFFTGDVSDTSENFLTGTSSVSVFSSLASSETIGSYDALGLITTNVYVDGSSGNLISDSLLGLQYYVSSTEQNRPYLTLVSKTENLYLYKNELASSGAVYFSEKLNIDETKSYRENFAALQQQLGVSGELISSVSSEDFDNISPLSKKENKYTFTAKADGILYISSYILSGETIEDGTQKFEVRLLNDNACTDIAYIRAGETYEFVLSNTYSVINLETVKFEFLNYETASALCEKIKENSLELNLTKNGYTVKTSEGQNGYAYIFSPNINGMNYSVNGNDASAETAFGSMVVLGVQANDEIVATYKFPHKISWAIVAAVCIALIFTIALIYKFTKFKKLETAITYAIYGINCCILAIFYFFGLLLSFIKIRL